MSSRAVPQLAMTRPETAKSATSATTPTDHSTPIAPSGMSCARQFSVPKL